MNHGFQDAVSLEIARRVAARLEAAPDLVEVARSNLERWSQMNTGAPSLLRCYSEWREILAGPIAEICRQLRVDSDEAQRLRQNSPFAGVLSAAEVWAIKRELRHAATPA